MTQQQQNLIRRLKIALLVVLVLSIYMTGIVLSISVVKSTLNPFRLIRLFGEYGFPWKMFLGCFLFIGIGISILMAYSASERASIRWVACFPWRLAARHTEKRTLRTRKNTRMSPSSSMSRRQLALSSDSWTRQAATPLYSERIK